MPKSSLLDNAFVTYLNVTFKTKQYFRNALYITKQEEEGAAEKEGIDEEDEEENIYIKRCNC